LFYFIINKKPIVSWILSPCLIAHSTLKNLIYKKVYPRLPLKMVFNCNTI